MSWRVSDKAREVVREAQSLDGRAADAARRNDRAAQKHFEGRAAETLRKLGCVERLAKGRDDR